MGKWWESLSPVTKVLVVGLALFLLICAFPPWEYTFSLRGTHSTTPAGYHFFFSPPQPKRSSLAYGVRISFTQILVEWAAVIFSVIVGVFIASKWEKEKREKELSLVRK